MRVAAAIPIALSLVACPGEEASPRTQIAARRHVLVAVPGEVIASTVTDGTVMDAALCAHACSPALWPGESVAACFTVYDLPGEAEGRFVGPHRFFDCALR